MLAPEEPGIEVPASYRYSKATSTTESYGEVIPPTILPVVQPVTDVLLSDSPQPVISQSLVSSHSTVTSAHDSGSPSSQRTLDGVRDQVAQSIAVRTISKAEIVDSSKVGVVLTMAPSSDPLFLRRVASKIKHSLLTSSYLFAISTTSPPGSSVPLLICGSSEEFVARAALLVGAKFLGRLEPNAHHMADGPRWVGLVRDLGATPFDEIALWDVVRKAARSPMDPLDPPPGSMGIEQMLASARTRLERIKPETAYSELLDPSSPWPAVLVDIRPEAQRQVEGAIGGALVVERNVLEWRFDPRCAHRLPVADRYDLRVIVFCSEGYTSSLAAAALHDLGLLNATDVIGGYNAWKQAGLPSEVEVVATGIPMEDYWSVSRAGDSRRAPSSMV
jgi:rhodanese-related sulfurtransferase